MQVVIILTLIVSVTFWLCQDILRPYAVAFLYAVICAILLNAPFFTVYIYLRLVLVSAVPPALRAEPLRTLFKSAIPHEFLNAPHTCFPLSIVKLVHRYVHVCIL